MTRPSRKQWLYFASWASPDRIGSCVISLNRASVTSKTIEHLTTSLRKEVGVDALVIINIQKLSSLRSRRIV